jgi:hypothetical protein
MYDKYKMQDEINKMKEELAFTYNILGDVIKAESDETIKELLQMRQNSIFDLLSSMDSWRECS